MRDEQLRSSIHISWNFARERANNVVQHCACHSNTFLCACHCSAAIAFAFALQLTHRQPLPGIKGVIHDRPSLKCRSYIRAAMWYAIGIFNGCFYWTASSPDCIQSQYCISYSRHAASNVLKIVRVFSSSKSSLRWTTRRSFTNTADPAYARRVTNKDPTINTKRRWYLQTEYLRDSKERTLLSYHRNEISSGFIHVGSCSLVNCDASSVHFHSNDILPDMRQTVRTNRSWCIDNGAQETTKVIEFHTKIEIAKYNHNATLATSTDAELRRRAQIFA